jgi:hypothetical protein
VCACDQLKLLLHIETAAVLQAACTCAAQAHGTFAHVLLQLLQSAKLRNRHLAWMQTHHTVQRLAQDYPALITTLALRLSSQIVGAEAHQRAQDAQSQLSFLHS